MVQPTTRDIEILGWLSRFRGATAGHIARRFGMGYSRVSRRMNQLGACGLVVLERVRHRQPGLYLVTKRGQAVAGADLPVAELGLAAYEHAVAVVDVAINAELVGDRVVTQRQMETLEIPVGGAASKLLYAVELADTTRHFPDLVVERADGRWAVEVQLTDPRSELLEAILRAYAAADHLSGVIYRVASTVQGERIQRVADALELGDRFKLHEVALNAG